LLAAFLHRLSVGKLHGFHFPRFSGEFRTPEVGSLVVSAAIGALLFFRIAVFAVVVSPTNSAFFSALAHRGYVIEALAFVTLKREPPSAWKQLWSL